MPKFSKIAFLTFLIGSNYQGVAQAAEEVIADAQNKQAISDLLAGKFRWKSTPPLISPASRSDDPCGSIKDPAVVWFD